MAPANRSEPTAHEVVAVAVDVFEEMVRNEVVVVQLHEDARRLAENSNCMGGILPDAGVPMGEPICLGDKPPEIAKHFLLRGQRAHLDQISHLGAQVLVQICEDEANVLAPLPRQHKVDRQHLCQLPRPLERGDAEHNSRTSRRYPRRLMIWAVGNSLRDLLHPIVRQAHATFIFEDALCAAEGLLCQARPSLHSCLIIWRLRVRWRIWKRWDRPLCVRRCRRTACGARERPRRDGSTSRRRRLWHCRAAGISRCCRCRWPQAPHLRE